MIITKGNTSFNTDNFKGWNRTEFMLQYCGLTRGVNLSDVWEEIQKELGNSITIEDLKPAIDEGIKQALKELENDTKSYKRPRKKDGEDSKSKRIDETPISAAIIPQTDN